jgi:hypothetical protein
MENLKKVGKIRSINQNFSHTYEKDQTTFVDFLTASLVMTYTSQRIGVHNVAFAHVKILIMMMSSSCISMLLK